MSAMDRRLIIQMKILYSLVVLLIVLVGANFAIAFSRPNEKTQTIVGTIGPRGDTGNPGDKGPKGDTGGPGPKGSTGNDGALGKDGTSGVDGVNGLSGTNGKDGLDGNNGANGRTPELACIQDAVYWKYTDETEWHLLYSTTCPIVANSVSD